MKKSLFALVFTVLIAGSVFSNPISQNEKQSIKSFLSDGNYIECDEGNGGTVFIKNSKINTITFKDGKITVHFLNGEENTFSYDSISIDDNKNLLVRKDAKSNATEKGKVLNIYTFNDELEGIIRNFFPGYNIASDRIGDVQVKWNIIPNSLDTYQMSLDHILAHQDTLSNDDKVDMFIVEPDYIQKYTDSPYTLDLKADLGITDEEFSRQFKYTQDIGSAGGKLKAVSWNCCPSGLIYRRSIAREVFGTDNPDIVQEMLSDWTKFNAAAEKVKSVGYSMVSGPNDNFLAFADNKKTPWVVDGKINVDDSIREWIAQQKMFSDKDYSNKAHTWTEAQFMGMSGNEKVFCFFGPSWFIDFVMAPQCEWNNRDVYGDWAFCMGPQGFNWGGTWICAAAGSDNLDLVKEIILKITTDDKTMEKIARENFDFVNNMKAMSEIANSDYENKFLGGQNHIKFLIDIAKSLDKSTLTIYDMDMNSMLMNAMDVYFRHAATEDEAWDIFYESVKLKYPNLKK